MLSEQPQDSQPNYGPTISPWPCGIVEESPRPARFQLSSDNAASEELKVVDVRPLPLPPYDVGVQY